MDNTENQNNTAVKGRILLANRMNFWKGSKRPLTPTPQIGPNLWKSCVCILYYLSPIPTCIYTTIFIIKKLQYDFPVKGRLELFGKYIRFQFSVLSLYGCIILVFCIVHLWLY